jgi:6-phosphogluconolactonase/glucosamine-6-phosphate isomerase/deaminase
MPSHVEVILSFLYNSQPNEVAMPSSEQCPLHLRQLSQDDCHAHLRRCPQASAITTGELLRAHTELSHVRIVPIELLGRAAWAESTDKFSTDLGVAGAFYFGRELANAVALGNMQARDKTSFKLGVSGGRSIFGLFSSLTHMSFEETLPRSQSRPEVLIEPLVVGPLPHSLFSAMSISELAEQRFDRAKALKIATPKFVDGHFGLVRREDLPDERQAFDWLVLGIGAKASSSFDSHLKVVYQHDLETIKDRAVGDICSRLFDENGREIDGKTGDKFVQVELIDLAVMAKRGSGRRVMVVAGGKNKVDAIEIVLRQREHLINSLVTDELTAHSLIARFEKRPRPKDNQGVLDIPE